MLPPKKIIWSLVNNSINLLIGFGTMVIVTRVFNPYLTGIWILFITMFSFASKIREGLVQSALVKYAVGVNENEKLKVWNASFYINILVEIIICLTIVGASFLFLKDKNLKTLFFFYPIYGLPWAIYQWQLFVLRSQINVEKIFKINSLILIVLIIGFSAIAKFSMPLKSMVLILALGSALSAFVGLRMIKIKFLFSKPDISYFKKLLQFGKHGILREFAGTLSNRVNVFLTAGILTMTDTAMLGLAEKYTQLILVPNAAIQGLLFPVAVGFAATKSYDHLKKLYESTVAMSLAIFIPIALFILLGIPFIILFVNGSEYSSAVPLLSIMLVSFVLFMPFGNSFGSIINAIGEPQINTKVVFINSIINIILSFLLINTIGIYGAVLAPFLTELFGFIWIGSILKQKLNISFLHCFVLIPLQYVKGYKLLISKFKKINQKTQIPKQEHSSDSGSIHSIPF